ncbi:leucine-rich repeat protein 1 [Anopheles gambiae]|uniref:leucine-rich repeat protein 1 n=1 Tax=Anopheles gambiae TaxID=7165 RepID=UPI002AC9300C|nr:leucine-rich repeat protein 1 [Anopheles gambiae]
MKLICETCTINRSVAGGKRAFQKTILAIGKGSERKGDETKIMLITTANKSGTKYSVLKNISKIFTRFLEEGKATISFVTPEHDVQIKSDKVQLTAFLKVLKLVLTGCGQPAEGTQPVTNPFSPSAPLRLPCLTVGKKKASILDSPSVLATKCVITNRKDYPTKGFSRLLVSLQITDVKLSRFDSQILLLQKLRFLNLSNNCLRSLPRALGQLRLSELDLSSNRLADCTFDWLLEPNIQSSLQSLNISDNGLSFLPINVINAGAMVALTANNNHIRKLPFALWTMGRLRVLSLAKNQIDGVPETLERIRLERLDLSENNLSPDGGTAELHPSPSMQQRQPSTLFELAARIVIHRKLPYAMPGLLPFTVVDIIRRVPLCGCGQPCFDAKVYQRTKVINGRCSCLVLNANHLLIADSVFCSEKCIRKANERRLHNRGL